MVTIQPVAWRCIWRKFGKSAWEQYHDETDPLPGTWDCAPNEIIALYDQAAVDALRKDAERLRDRVERLRGLCKWASGKLLDAGDHKSAVAVLALAGDSEGANYVLDPESGCVSIANPE